jgi:hypothetical protein
MSCRGCGVGVEEGVGGVDAGFHHFVRAARKRVGFVGGTLCRWLHLPVFDYGCQFSVIVFPRRAKENIRLTNSSDNRLRAHSAFIASTDFPASKTDDAWLFTNTSGETSRKM